MTACRRTRQRDVGECDAPDTSLKHLDFDFGMLELSDLFVDRLEGTFDVGSNDDVQFRTFSSV